MVRSNIPVPSLQSCSNMHHNPNPIYLRPHLRPLFQNETSEKHLSSDRYKSFKTYNKPTTQVPRDVLFVAGPQRVGNLGPPGGDLLKALGQGEVLPGWPGFFFFFLKGVPVIRLPSKSGLQGLPKRGRVIGFL